MRKPNALQRSVARPVKQQRRLAAGRAGHWTPSPSPSSPKPTYRLVRSWGSKCFSEEEEDLLVKLHALLGNRWSLIAGRLPGRTGKEVESHWNSKLKRVGVDPDNHRSMALLALALDDGQRRRPLDSCEVECPAKRLNRRLSSNDGIATDKMSLTQVAISEHGRSLLAE